MKGEAPNMSSKEMAQIRQNLEGTPDIEEAAELMNLAGNSTRLKLLYLLDNMKELCVCDLAEMLGVSVSAVSQHLAVLLNLIATNLRPVRSGQLPKPDERA